MEVKTKQDRIVKLAEEHAGEALVSIHHNIDEKWLKTAYESLPWDKAPGADEVTKAEYGERLDENLTELLRQVRTRTYRAPAVKRVEIAKGTSGEKRKLGLPSFEDKVLQKSFVMLVDGIFEREFHDFSYGFRRGKSAHDAVKDLWEKLGWTGKWIIDLDIQKFFDTIDHMKLREMFSKRIKDGVLNKLVLGWLKAGVMKEGIWETSGTGTPQGGIVSPLLANLYLHEVLDTWFVTEVQHRLKGKSGMVRYADDAVLYFEREEDAERVMEVLGKRLEKFGLKLHPEKTHLQNFEKPEGREKKETFDFLGFTYYWGKSRKGKRIIKLKTSRKKLPLKLRSLKEWLKKNRHISRQEQHEKLSAKLRGLYNYYGVSYNVKSLMTMLYEATKMWRKSLKRTSRRRKLSWKKFRNYLEVHPLPKPRIMHKFF